MNTERDYYACLGVLPSAEDIVIRAAYKALAQRYHPDRYEGDPAEASKRMQDINEAYEVLSDSAKRKKYDGARQQKAADFGLEEDGVRSAFEDASSAFAGKWQTALEYYPDLDEIVARLRTTSFRLGFAFQALLLETKRFEQRSEIAAQLERNFLETYFGTHPKIIAFAKELIELGARDAARDLNQAVAVLGSGADADRVISRLEMKYKLQTLRNKTRNGSATLNLAKQLVWGGNISFNGARALFDELGGQMKYEVLERGLWGFIKRIRISASLWGKQMQFESEDDFANWVRKEVAPMVVQGLHDRTT
jgi:curved DNA-binding protein CbpA